MDIFYCENDLEPYATGAWVLIVDIELNASISTGLWSVCCRQWYALEQTILQNKYFHATCCPTSVSVLTDVSCLCNRLISNCLI